MPYEALEGPHALIAAISPSIPNMAITRLMLQASTLTDAAASTGFHLGSSSSGAAIGGIQVAQADIASEVADTGYSSATISAAAARGVAAGGLVSSTADLSSVVTQGGILAQFAAARGVIGRALVNAVNGVS